MYTMHTDQTITLLFHRQWPISYGCLVRTRCALDTLGKRTFSRGIASIRLAVSMSIFLIANWCMRIQPTMGGTIPRLAEFGYVKRLDKHKPEAAFFCGLCLRSHLQAPVWVPALISLKMDCKPFLPQVDFRHGVYHSNRKQARTRYSHVLSVLFKELRMYIQTAQHPRVLLKVMLEVTHVQGAAR